MTIIVSKLTQKSIRHSSHSFKLPIFNVIANYRMLASIKVAIFSLRTCHMQQLEISIMFVSYSAATANRHINTGAKACTRRGMRIMVMFALLVGVKCNDYIESKVVSQKFRAFGDFLAQKHLKHAIIAYNSEILQHEERLETIKELRELVNITTLHFYDVHHAKNSKNFTNFKNLFFYDTPRVGIYLTQLEDVLLQEEVLGTNSENSVSCITPDGNDVGVQTFLRFNNSQAWFIMSKEQDVEAALLNIRKMMNPLPLNISADITLGVRIDADMIQLFDIYKVQTDLLEIEEKGYWSSKNGLQLKKRFLQSFVSRRRDFKGLQLRAGIVIREKPDELSEWDYLNSLEYKKLDPMQRKSYQMMRLIEPMFNVSFQTKFKFTWGKHWPNGSWDGVMAMLLSGEAELSMNPMRFVTNRVQLIHYSPAIHTEYIYFIFRHPRRNDIRNIFFEPFVEEVWYSVVAVVVVTTLLLLIQLHHEHRFFLNKDPHFQYRFDYAVLTITEAFFMQGPDHNAFAATSTRILIFFVCLFSLLLQQFYGAFIVGSLLAVAPRTITNLEALYNSSLELGMENIPYNMEFFENTTSPLGQAIYTQRICKNRERHVLSIEEGAERIAKGGFAFHVAPNRMYILLKDMLKDKEFCDLQEVEFLPPLHIGIGIGKLSPFREYFTSSILKWRTTGLMQHKDIQWKLPRLDCSLSQNREVEVDLQHFLPAILLLCSGMLVSVAVLVLEIIYFNLENGLKLARFCPSLLPEQKLEFIN